VTQIADALALGKATAHALVHALLAAGALEPAGGKKYRIGPVLESLAASRRRRHSLAEVCGPLLEQLAAELDQTAVLGVVEGDRLCIVAASEGSAALRVGAPPGTRIPLLAGAHGKVVLVWGPWDGAPPLARFASRLPTEPGALQRELQDVRQTGVAYSRGDYLEGLVAAAAPVLDPTGTLLGVLYAFGLGDVIGDPGLLRAGQRVRQAAQTATRRWGGAP
jgi:DNA-binding IclR family transcriptional regulator